MENQTKINGRTFEQFLDDLHETAVLGMDSVKSQEWLNQQTKLAREMYRQKAEEDKKPQESTDKSSLEVGEKC